jgi:hypothetical protein
MALYRHIDSFHEPKTRNVRNGTLSKSSTPVDAQRRHSRVRPNRRLDVNPERLFKVSQTLVVCVVFGKKYYISEIPVRNLNVPGDLVNAALRQIDNTSDNSITKLQLRICIEFAQQFNNWSRLFTGEVALDSCGNVGS